LFFFYFPSFGTIPADGGLFLSLSLIAPGRNIVHGSDSVESAERELALWFPEGLLEYERAVDKYVYEQ
jgi:hypothetical protein